MKRLVIITALLLTATVLVTILYFKNLSTPGQHTTELMRNIPADAALIFEISNDQSFYDIFAGNQLFVNFLGQEKMDGLNGLRNELLNDALLKTFTSNQNIFMSVHPLKAGGSELLFTASVSKDFKKVYLDQLMNNAGGKMVIQPIQIGGKRGYGIFFKTLKKHFYLVHKTDDIFCGSFSKELIEKAAVYNGKKSNRHFVLMPDRQNTNSLASLYVNYSQLSPLLEQFFAVKNTGIFKSFQLLTATAALTMNYKTDALMFNGTTTLLPDGPSSYLNLFSGQQPIENHLKDVFPSTTAYSTSFAVSDPVKFSSDLGAFHSTAGLGDETKILFNKISAETGIKLQAEFARLLGNEFGIITTRYQEKIAVIQLKNGMQLRPIMIDISNMTGDDIGQFKYDKLPFFLIGDAFNVFKKPYFKIMDNYLVLANSAAEINSYHDSFYNRKFLNKISEYHRFDELLSERSNVSFFINFRNTQRIFKEELLPGLYDRVAADETGWKNFYGASYQLSSANKNYYTNFCMQLNPPDTLSIKK